MQEQQQPQSTDVPLATTNNTIFIYKKENDDQGKKYRVTPSPKLVELGTVLHFRNLTELPATVDALNVLEPDHLDLPAGQSRPAKVVGATGKSHPYKVKVGTEWAHGSSDPDLIIP